MAPSSDQVAGNSSNLFHLTVLRFKAWMNDHICLKGGMQLFIHILKPLYISWHSWVISSHKNSRFDYLSLLKSQ